MALRVIVAAFVALTVAAFPVAGQSPPPSQLRMVPWGREAVAVVLKEVDEPALRRDDPSLQTVRLVVVPAFPNWRSVVVRVTREDRGVQVIANSLDSWYVRPVRKAFPEKRLSPSVWPRIYEALVKGLWSYSPEPAPNRNTTDGAVWYLEATGPRGYIDLVQHVPSGGAFKDLCRELLWLTDVDFTQSEYVEWIIH